MDKFWNFKNTSETEAELLLYGYIAESSWWDDIVSSKQFAKDLKDLGDIKNLTVRINSGGGDVFAGHAIYQMLKDHAAKIVTKVEGLAASAASVILMAGDEIIVPSGSFVMIHNPSSVAWGEAKDFEKMAETLNTIKDGIVNIYMAKTGKDKKTISKMMDEETWMTGEDAVKEGFADKVASDSITEPVLNGKLLIVNNISHDLSKFKTIPNIEQRKPSAPQVAAPQTLPVANKIKTQEVENAMEIKNVADLEAAYPQLVKEVRDTAKAEGMTEERTRLQTIDDISNAIAPELLNKAKYQEPITAEQLAIAALKSDTARATNFLNGLTEDAKESRVNNVDGSSAEEADQAKNQAQEEQKVNMIAEGGNKRRNK